MLLVEDSSNRPITLATGEMGLLSGSVELMLLFWGGIGSYYYSNPSGSTYHNDGKGGATYTAPGGKK